MVIKSFHLLCWFAFVSLHMLLPAQAQSKLALVIGNAQYSQLPVLVNPANDAKLLSVNLEQLGFAVTVLTDQSQAQMKASIAQFSQAVTVAGPDTIAMLYYAGHGVQIDGTNYLIPVDANVQTAGDVVLGAVSASDLLKTLELAQAKVNVLVLDACRDNPFKSNTRGISRGLARVQAPAGSIVAYATAPGQVAADGNGGNSPYAEALAKNLTTAGLPLESVFRQVRIEVSEKTSGEQVPWEETSLTQEVILKTSSTQANQQPPAVTSSNSTELGSAQAYMLAVGTNKIEDYQAFLQKHPTAQEAPKALRNIEMLADEKNWRAAVEQNSLGAYRIYLNLHPQGSYAVDAQNQIASLSAKAIPTPPPPPPIDPMFDAPGYDVFGVDMKAVRNISFVQCRAACAETQSCVAITYRQDLRRCYPKSAATVIVRNTKSDAAFKTRLKGKIRVSKFDFFPQYDVSGSDYADLKVNDAQSCLDVCENDQGCRAFAYATKNKTCYLKSTANGVNEAPAVVSGVRQ
jgi:uncharacterized caspase-like protein